MKLSSILRRVPSVLAWTLLAAACVCTFYLVVVMGETPELSRAAQESAQATAAPRFDPRPLDGAVSPQNAAAYFPAELLSLPLEEPLGANAEDVKAGTDTCRVVTLTYEARGGVPVRCVSAWPAAYLTTLPQAGYAPDAATGMRLRGLDAVHLSGQNGEGALVVRTGDVVYALFGPDEQTALYALGEETFAR